MGRSLNLSQVQAVHAVVRVFLEDEGGTRTGRSHVFLEVFQVNFTPNLAGMRFCLFISPGGNLTEERVGLFESGRA